MLHLFKFLSTKIRQNSFNILTYPQTASKTVKIPFKHKKTGRKLQPVSKLAPPHGFEPRYQQPECRVLPLDEGGITDTYLRRFILQVNYFSL